MATTIFNEEFLTQWAKNLYADGGSFTQLAKNYSQFTTGRTVNMPQSGSRPSAGINPTIPATATARVDDFMTFNNSHFATEPTYITDYEEFQLAPNKRADVFADHIDTLKELVENQTIYDWARDYTGTEGTALPATSSFFTSGAVASLANPAGDQDRKRLKFVDLIPIKKEFDKQNISKKGRYVLLPSQMYNDLLQDGDVGKYQIVNTGNTPIGFTTDFAMVYGFTILQYEADVYTDGVLGGNVVQAPGTAVTSLSNYMGVAWQQDSVCYAMGKNQVFVRENDPFYYGDVMDADLVHGAHRTRKDNKGFATITQAE
jgi:hypothetical protein